MSIKKCDCKDSPAAKYQDERYGKGMRVHTQFIKEGGGYRCTVCGREKDISAK